VDQVSQQVKDDSETFDMISSGDTMGVYLLESQGVRDILKKIKPRNFNDFVNAISLYRPAPLEGGLWKVYVENAVKRGKVLLPHSSLAAALVDTRGILLYIEQVRRVIEISAGLGGKKAYEIERALKTRDSGVLMGARLNFIRGAMDNDIDEKGAEKIFDFLLKNIKYTHYKALSCSQAYLSYRSAYLKNHYFEDYFAALLSVYGDSPDKASKCANYFKGKGRYILPPDVNISSENYIAEGEDIRSPITDFNGMSDETCRRIVEERRKNGEFGGISDFLKRVTGIPEMPVYGMIEEGFFDSLGKDRKTMEDECVKFFERRKILNPEDSKPVRKKDSKGKKDSGQISLFDEEPQ
jgi:DNA polymerase-3 subunit alpha